MGKISVPSDFGVENMDCVGKCNVSLVLRGGEELRANSVILGYNGSEFDRIFTEYMLTTLDMDDFDPAAVRDFVTAMYQGTILIQAEQFRDIHKMAFVFDVKWVVKECDEFFVTRCSTIDGLETFSFIIDEAAFCLQKLEKMDYSLAAISASGNPEVPSFIEQYMVDYDRLSPEHLDVLIDIEESCPETVKPILGEIVLNKLEGSVTVDAISLYLVKHIGLEKYPISKNSKKRKLFDKLLEMILQSEELSVSDLRFFCKLQLTTLSMYREKTDTTIQKMFNFPNLFEEWSQYVGLSFEKFRENVELDWSAGNKSLYKVIECYEIAFLYFPVTVEIRFAELTNHGVLTKLIFDNCFWSIPKSFIETLPSTHSTQKRFKEALGYVDPASTRSVAPKSIRAVSDLTPTMWDFLTKTASYTFHFDTESPEQARRSPPFIVNVTGVSRTDPEQFNITLELDLYDPEITPDRYPNPGSLHVVLETLEWLSDPNHDERQWVNEGLLSWFGKPVYSTTAENYIDFPGRGFNDTSYSNKSISNIRLVVYYNEI